MEITPLTPHLAAEVHGIDLSRPVPDAIRVGLAEAFARYGVLAIRGQTLQASQMLEAVQIFGPVFRQHNTRFALPDCPEIHYISNQDSFPDGRRYIPGEGWHTDHSNDTRPPKATVLHAITLPDHGGDTQFANMTLAYETLPAATRERIDGLFGIHVYQSSHSTRKLMNLPDTARERVPNAVLHPMVRTHPDTGRKAIYINPIRIEGILGLDHREALPLLDTLLEHSTQEALQYRHRWLPGDLVIWDNRRLLHKANGDYDMAQTRYLYRVMLQGDVPA